MHSNIVYIYHVYLVQLFVTFVTLTLCMAHTYVDQKVMHIIHIVRQHQPLKVEKSAQKAQMT